MNTVDHPFQPYDPTINERRFLARNRCYYYGPWRTDGAPVMGYCGLPEVKHQTVAP